MHTFLLDLARAVALFVAMGGILGIIYLIVEGEFHDRDD